MRLLAASTALEGDRARLAFECGAYVQLELGPTCSLYAGRLRRQLDCREALSLLSQLLDLLAQCTYMYGRAVGDRGQALGLYLCDPERAEEALARALAAAEG